MYQMSLRSFTAVGTNARLNYLYKMTFYLRSESFPDVEQTKSLQYNSSCVFMYVSWKISFHQMYASVCAEYKLGLSRRQLLQCEREWKNQVRPRAD